MKGEIIMAVWGYARVSTNQQNEDRQVVELSGSAEGQLRSVAELLGGECQRLGGDGMAEGDAEGVKAEAACCLI